jgi:hypothetical protein
MPIKLFYILFIFTPWLLNAQNNFAFPSPNLNGKYEVGYTTALLEDPIRKFKNGSPRKIKISIWYPSEDKKGSHLRLGDYYSHYYEDTNYTKKDYYPTGSYFDQFADFLNVSPNARHKLYTAQLNGCLDKQVILEKKFPLILYAASYRGAPIENANLFELLASNGYVIAGIPSIGENNKEIQTDESGVNLQYEDFNLLQNYLKIKEYIDTTIVITAGHSFGAFPALVTAINQSSVKASFVLDGSNTYFKLLLDKLIPATTAFKKHYLQLSQSPLSSGNFVNRFYETNCIAQSYYFQFKNLVHQDFAGTTYLFVNNTPKENQWDGFYKNKIDKGQKEEAFFLTNKLILQFLNKVIYNSVDAGKILKNVLESPDKGNIFTDRQRKTPLH